MVFMSEQAEFLLTGFILGASIMAVALMLYLGRVRDRAFEAGLKRQAEKALAERQLLEERLDARVRDSVKAETTHKQALLERDQSNREARQLAVEVASLTAQRDQLATRADELIQSLEAVRNQEVSAARRATELETRLSETSRSFAEKEAMFKASSEQLKGEFQLLAQRIFQEHGQTFARNNKTQLDDLLTPFREQLSEFKQKVELVYVTESKDRASLLTEVRNLQRASERINEEAESLARALKGDKKVQGNWGELVLERVLDSSGLRRDHEYSVQASHRSESGEVKRPDIIIHLPDDKDIVVDSKVSLVAYERALAAEDEAERERLLRQHVADLRAQAKRLAEQDYDRLQGVRSLDFVLLFVPIESAFTLALQQDPGLFTEAFNRRIVIVSPTTLMMTLRIIHNVWRYEKQSRNAQEIAQRAGALYDKLRSAMEDLARLGATLRTADQNYQDAMRKLATGRGNLVRQVEQLRELGAPVRKAFPKETADAAEEGDEVVSEFVVDDKDASADESGQSVSEADELEVEAGESVDHPDQSTAN